MQYDQTKIAKRTTVELVPFFIANPVCYIYIDGNFNLHDQETGINRSIGHKMLRVTSADYFFIALDIGEEHPIRFPYKFFKDGQLGGEKFEMVTLRE